ncbi:MAG: ABC transporter ATP-binding protein [Agriterribacter sp.]
MQPAVEIKNMSFSYGDHSILENVNAAFPRHQFSVLLGTNGSGKSTLFRFIAGISQGYNGQVYINGTPAESLKRKQKAAIVGFLPQFYQTVFPFTVKDILLTGRAAFSGFSPSRKDIQQASQVLGELEIKHLQNKLFTELSGGEQQMVMIGRLLMQNPEIIVLDEPTNHLDVYYQQFLMEKLKVFAENGRTVITIMHNPTLAYLFANRFYFLHQKKIISSNDLPDMGIAMLRSVYNSNFLTLQHNNLKIVLPVSNR